MVANWAELPSDLLVLIAKRVKLIEDFIAFGGVCTSWRTAASKDNFDVLWPQVPLLMLPDKNDAYREFYSLSKGKVSRILYLPEARERKVYPSEGWLFTLSYKEEFKSEFNLLHPFSRAQIRLPSERNLWALDNIYKFDDFEKPDPFYQCVVRAVLSANPSLTSDYTLVISYYTYTNRLAFWHPGNLNWTKFEIAERMGGVTDMIYYKGQFYCVTHAGEICIFDIPGPSITQPILKSHMIKLEHDMFNRHSCQFYLVELCGVLLLVSRLARDDPNNEDALVTFKFKVYELEVTKCELKEINTLGNSTIFLGLNGASSIDSSKFMGAKPNHIYFTDDWCENIILEGGCGRDIGAYNLENEKIESFYPRLSLSPLCPPSWVTPSFQ